jgi:hypothetical protein
MIDYLDELEVPRKFVTSTNIKSVGYHQPSEGLVIEFMKGNVYLYSNVPEDTYRNLMNSISVGQYFNIMIKNKFDTEKLR